MDHTGSLSSPLMMRRFVQLTNRVKNLFSWPWTDSDVVQKRLETNFGLPELKRKIHSRTTKTAVEPKEPTVEVPTPEKVPQMDNAKGVWSGRLRSRKRVNIGEDAST